MKKLNEMPLRMVIATPYGVDAEKIIMIIQAIMICRNAELRDYYDFDELPLVVFETDNKNRFFSAFVTAEEITVEFMEVVAKFQDALPCEIYFENHGNTGAAYLESDDFEEGYIEDDALRRLVYEEKHDRREKLSA